MRRNWSGPVLLLSVLLACGSAGPGQPTGGAGASAVGMSESSAGALEPLPPADRSGPAPELCRDDADCPVGERCTGTGCRTACAVDAECGGATCHLASGTCAGGTCQSQADCRPAEVCETGRCVPTVPPRRCRPHTTRCDGGDLLVCDPAGRREDREPCLESCEPGPPGAHCSEDACQPWSVGCLDAATAFGCDDAGTAFEVEACGDSEYCEGGVCLPRVCEPGAVWCAGPALATCDDRGAAVALADCADSVACARPDTFCVCRQDRCEALTCLPGSGRCIARGLQRCNALGDGYLAVESCGPDHACREGACHRAACEPGSRTCRDEVLRVCDETGTDWIDRPCADEGAYCAERSGLADCEAWACRPGEAVCTEDGRDLLQCDARGTGTERVACSEWGCTAGACLPEPAPDGWVRIAPGRFQMGSPIDEPGRLPYETPHEVRITRPFFLQENEATQAEWAAVMGTNPSYYADCGEDCPVECVSFWDVLAYANRLSESEGRPTCYTLTGCAGQPGSGCAGEFLCDGDFMCEGAHFGGTDCAGYRLPTEAEWEYAARAGTQTAFYAGPMTVPGTDPADPVLERIAWYGGNSDGTTHPVATRAPNGWGVYDASGNVFELVWDWFTVDYETLGPDDPVGPPWGVNRVARGGSWFTEATRARSAYRHNLEPSRRVNSFGFRLARSALGP